MSDRKISEKSAGNEISDIELAAVVGGRTQVTREQYEQILADRQTQQKSWWQNLFS